MAPNLLRAHFIMWLLFPELLNNPLCQVGPTPANKDAPSYSALTFLENQHF